MSDPSKAGTMGRGEGGGLGSASDRSSDDGAGGQLSPRRDSRLPRGTARAGGRRGRRDRGPRPRAPRRASRAAFAPRRRRGARRPATEPCCGRTRRPPRWRPRCRDRPGASPGCAAPGWWSRPPADGRRRRNRAHPGSTARPRSWPPGRAAGSTTAFRACAAGPRRPRRRRPDRRSGATTRRTARRTRPARRPRRAPGRRRAAARPAWRRPARVRRIGPGRAGHVQVDDLAAGVHPGVGAPGHRQLRRGGQPQHPSERCGHDALYRAPAGLSGPPGKS